MTDYSIDYRMAEEWIAKLQKNANHPGVTDIIRELEEVKQLAMDRMMEQTSGKQ